jgi:hypothetical protein
MSNRPEFGKAACRAFEEDFLSKIKAVRTYVCDGYVISSNSKPPNQMTDEELMAIIREGQARDAKERKLSN